MSACCRYVRATTDKCGTLTDVRFNGAGRGLRPSLLLERPSLLDGSAIASGWLAGSVAVVALGLDSVIEPISGGALLYRLPRQTSWEE
jgi:hypothetical protein